MNEFINQILQGDVFEKLKELPDESVDCIITSPPYWQLRKYGENSQELGRERTFEEYVKKLSNVFLEAKRVLKNDGTCFVNLSDTYAGTMPKDESDVGKNSKIAKRLVDGGINGEGTKNQSIQDKSLCLIPYRFAIAMTENGWIARNVLIWWKRNAMPSSVTDRFTVDYEPIIFFTKSKKYYFKQQFERYTEPINRWGGTMVKRLRGSDEYGVKQRVRDYRPVEEGRNMRAVWDILTKPSDISHFAMYPDTLVARMIEAGCPKEGVVLDMFAGAGNTLSTARILGRKYIGIELYQKYIELIKERMKQEILV